LSVTVAPDLELTKMFRLVVTRGLQAEASPVGLLPRKGAWVACFQTLSMIVTLAWSKVYSVVDG
jgi:hypothetical protein